MKLIDQRDEIVKLIDNLEMTDTEFELVFGLVSPVLHGWREGRGHVTGPICKIANLINERPEMRALLSRLPPSMESK